MTESPILILNIAVCALYIIRVELFLLRITPSKLTGFIYDLDLVLLLNVVQILLKVRIWHLFSHSLLITRGGKYLIIALSALFPVFVGEFGFLFVPHAEDFRLSLI
jgi:hypothetical protein